MSKAPEKFTSAQRGSVSTVFSVSTMALLLATGIAIDSDRQKDWLASIEGVVSTDEAQLSQDCGR